MMQRVLPGLIAILLLTGCGHDKLDIDISKIESQPLKVQRLEDDMMKINETNLEEVTEKIRSDYGSFYDHYLAGFLNRGGSHDSLYKVEILKFTHDRDITGCYSQVKKHYTKEAIDKLLPELNDCVKRFKYHFPKRKTPEKLITCLTGWNFPAAYTHNSLVLGLDMYLGDTCIYYQMLHLPQFRTRYMNSNYILPGLAWGWMITEFDNADPVNTLLNHTIFYGKIYYGVNALLPGAHDTLLLNYTSRQYDYCKSNEKNLWSFFAEKNRLYENNLQTVKELTDDGPFTGAISKECPPRIAMWVGLQIVRSYMKNNEDVTLEQLMTEKDFQKILNKSKYRP